MKTTLKFVLFILGASLPCIAFAGLVGIVAPAAFFGSEIVLSIFAAAGLVLIGLNDYTYRRPALQIPAAPACPVIEFRPRGDHRGSMGLAA